MSCTLYISTALSTPQLLIPLKVLSIRRHHSIYALYEFFCTWRDLRGDSWTWHALSHTGGSFTIREKNWFRSHSTENSYQKHWLSICTQSLWKEWACTYFQLWTNNNIEKKQFVFPMLSNIICFPSFVWEDFNNSLIVHILMYKYTG